MVFGLFLLQGFGHKSAANAIHARLEARGVPAMAPECVVDNLGYPHQGIYQAHIEIVRRLPRVPHRRTWSHHFLAWARENWTLEQISGWRRRFLEGYTALSERPLLERLNRLKPSVIYTTHPLPTRVIVGLRNKGHLNWNPDLCSVSTELVFAPQDSPFISTHFAATEASAEQMRTVRGVTDDRLVVSGLPVHAPVYSSDEKAATRRTLGFVDTAPTVYVAGGGFGRGDIRDWVSQLKKVPKLQIIVVCGLNVTAYHELHRAELQNPRVKVFGLLSDPTSLMSTADLYVGLEGGATAAQMVNYGAVSIFPFPTSHANARFLQEVAGAEICQSVTELPAKVEDVLRSIEFRRARILKVARPDAADVIAQTIETLHAGERKARRVSAG